MLLVCVGGIRLARKGHTVGPPIVRWVVPSTHRDFSAVLHPIELIFCMWIGSTITLLPTENQLIWLENCREITVGGQHHPPYYRRAECSHSLELGRENSSEGKMYAMYGSGFQ